MNWRRSYDQYQNGKLYKSYPLTCSDYNNLTGGATGAGATGPLSIPILAALHSKNNVWYDRVNKADFSNSKEAKTAAGYVMNYISELKGRGANNEASHFSTLSRQIFRDLSKAVLSHEFAIKSLIPMIVKIRNKSDGEKFGGSLKRILVKKCQSSWIYL